LSGSWKIRAAPIHNNKFGTTRIGESKAILRIALRSLPCQARSLAFRPQLPLLSTIQSEHNVWRRLCSRPQRRERGQAVIPASPVLEDVTQRFVPCLNGRTASHGARRHTATCAGSTRASQVGHEVVFSDVTNYEGGANAIMNPRKESDLCTTAPPRYYFGTPVT
jgi:hypothetical protein